MTRYALVIIAAVVAISLASRQAVAPRGIWPMWIEGSFWENFFAWFSPVAFAMAAAPFRVFPGAASGGAGSILAAFFRMWLFFGAALLLLRLALLWPAIQYLENAVPIAGPVYAGAVSVLFVGSCHYLLHKLLDCSGAYALSISLLSAGVGQVWARWDHDQIFCGVVFGSIFAVGPYISEVENRWRRMQWGRSASTPEVAED